MLDKEIAVSLGAQNVHWRNITISRYDTLWRFIFTVYDGNDVYSIPSGSAIVLIGRKPDDTVFMYSGELVDGKAVVICGDQMSSSSGAVKCELRITEISGIVSSANFILDVEASPSSGFTLSKNDFTALDQLVSQAASASAAIGNTAEVVAGINSEIESLKSLVGSPLQAATISAMTDHDRIYIYTGSETGYVSGNWYYWTGASWTSGGVYNAVAVNTDTSLSVADMAADAKSVGDAIRTDTTLSIADRAADAGVVGEALRSDSVDYAFTIVRGSISSSTGGNTSSTTRLRTQGYLPVTTSWGTVVHIPEGMEATIFVYSTAGQSGYEGLYNGTATWATKAGNNILTGLKGKFIRVVLRFDNDATIVVADAANVKIYTLTELDNTLGKPGAAAESKAVGDILPKAFISRRQIQSTNGVRENLNDADFKVPGYYYWASHADVPEYTHDGITESIPGGTTGGGVLVFSNASHNRVVQIIVSRTGAIFTRYYNHTGDYGGWSDFCNYALKDDTVAVQTLLTAVDDMDTDARWGIYRYQSSSRPAHAPKSISGGVVLSLDASPSVENFKVQIAVGAEGMAWRYKTLSGWGDWLDARSKPNLTLPDYYFDDDYLPNRAAVILGHIDGMSEFETLSNDTTPVAVGVRGDTFAWLTDPHLWHYLEGETEAENEMRSVPLLKWLGDHAMVRKVFVGGDLYTGNLTKEYAKEMLEQARDYFAPIRDNTYMIIGNHEWNNERGQNGTPTQYSRMVPQAHIYNQLLKDREMVYGSTDRYGDYWVDNRAQEIRYFCIGCEYRAVILPEQVVWFAKELQNVPDGYTVVVLSHVGLQYQVDENTEEVTFDCMGRMRQIVKLLSAARAHAITTYPSDTPPIMEWDYTNFRGEIAGVISGHMHGDACLIVRDENNPLDIGFPIIATTLDRGPKKLGTASSEAFIEARTPGTILEQAFDVVQIDIIHKKIYLTRIGGSWDITQGAPLDNPDREFSYGFTEE